MFYGHLLRNPFGGAAILVLLIGLSSLSGRGGFRHAVFAALYLLAALLPFPSTGARP